MADLTKIQEIVYEVIVKSWEMRGKPPTDAEITRKTGAGAAKYHVGNLQKQGYISSDGHRRVLKDIRGNKVKMRCVFVQIPEKHLQNENDSGV